MKKLIFDTETTGLARFDLPSSHMYQPRIVSLAFLFIDDSCDLKLEFSCLIKPVGFKVPCQVSQIHGITQERAIKEGFDKDEVISKFQGLINSADIIIGHNVKFDIVVAEREGINFKGKPTYCTMLNSTNVLKIKKKHGYKWPKLAECVKYFFNEDLEGAHDALNDVRACARVFEKLQELSNVDKDENQTGPSPAIHFPQPTALYEPQP